MKIENSLIKTALFGALQIPEGNGILMPRRFTDKQFEYFIKTENYIHKLWKGRSGAGINLDFLTDSEDVNLKVRCFSAGPHPFCYFDVYIDGILKKHIGYTKKDADKEVEISLKLNNQKKRITIYFPTFFGVDILDFNINDGAFFEPAKKECKIMFFGDSITQGYITPFPSLTYTNIVARSLNADCVNQGIGAGVFNENDLDKNFPYVPDTVIVAYGTNDWTHNRNIEMEASIYLDKLIKIYPKSKIYVILPIWRCSYKIYEEHTTVTFDEMHDNLKCACEKFKKVTVIDGRTLVPHLPEFFNPDGTHPNELGFLHYGENLLKIIRENEK